MKKEVKVKTYTRKTKSGKTVVVKAHTAKRDCTGQREGAGGELKALKGKEGGTLDNDILKALDEIPSEDMQKYLEGNVTRQGRITRKVDSIVRKYLGRKKFDDWSYYIDETFNYGKNLKDFKRILGRFKSGKGAKDLQKALDAHPVFEYDASTKKGRVISAGALRKEERRNTSHKKSKS